MHLADAYLQMRALWLAIDLQIQQNCGREFSMLTFDRIISVLFLSVQLQQVKNFFHLGIVTETFWKLSENISSQTNQYSQEITSYFQW